MLIWLPSILFKIPACLPFVAGAFTYNVDLIGENACSANHELGVLCHPDICRHYLRLEVARGEIFGGWLDYIHVVLWRQVAKPRKPCPSQTPEETGVQREERKGGSWWLPCMSSASAASGEVEAQASPSYWRCRTEQPFTLRLRRTGFQIWNDFDWCS